MKANTKIMSLQDIHIFNIFYTHSNVTQHSPLHFSKISCKNDKGSSLKSHKTTQGPHFPHQNKFSYPNQFTIFLILMIGKQIQIMHLNGPTNSNGFMHKVN